jgi:SAM-dependent methyltransferase
MPGNESRECPLCRAHSVVFEMLGPDADARPDRVYKIFRCADCGVAFTEVPDETDRQRALYPEFYYGTQTLVNRAAIALFQRLRVRAARRACPEGKRLLDVGAGDGRFVLEARQHGWDAYGVEPSSAGRSGAAEHGVLDRMFFSGINEVPLEKESIDLVTLWHSLEHAEAPHEILSAAHALLRPEGRILVSLPNYEGLAMKWFPKQFFHLETPRHLWHFSPESFGRLLNRCGFQLLRVSHFSLEYSPFGWWQTWLNVFGLELNSLYRWLKRGDPFTRQKGIAKAVAVIETVGFSILVLPLSFGLSLFEALVRKGMILTVFAEKTNSHANE